MDFVRRKLPLFKLFLILCCLSLFGPQDLARSGDGSLFSKKNRKLAASSPQTIEVPAPYDFTPVAENPVPVTHISTITGSVADDNDAAVAGATVQAVNPDNPEESFETTTDSQGKYILPVNFKSYAWETLQKFDLNITRDGFTTKQKLVDVIANRTAGAGKSILKILDSVITRIGSEGGTHTNSLGDLKVIIPPGALSGAKDIRTTLYNKSKQLPAPLPSTSFYTYSGLLTADGGDIEFNQPVTVQIANSLGFAPGTKIPIGYYKEDTRQWDDSGQMSTVSADGRWVEFQTTHFSTPDCNLPALPPPKAQGPTGSNNGPVVNNASTNINTNNQASNCNASRIVMRTGNLYQEHFLPSVRAMNQDITPEFAYNSTTAKPSVLLAAQTDLDSRYTTQPETQSVTFEIEGIEASATYQNTLGKNAERFMWDGKNGQGELVSTGSYPYTITLSNDYIGTYYTADSFGGPPINDTGVETREPVPSTTVVKGRTIVNNQVNSSFGSGWNLANLKRLYPDPDGRLLLVEGDGSSRIYDIPKEDIAVSNQLGNSFSVLLGNGDGTFQTHVPYTAGDGPPALAIGDFNEDDIQDVVVVNRIDGNISLYIGNGNGTFQSQILFDVGDYNPYPSSIAVGDFNKDEKDDLVVTNFNDDNISVLIGKGDGNFYPQLTFTVGDAPHFVAISDFNNDEIQDLVVVTSYDSSFSILLGIGDGTFAPQVATFWPRIEAFVAVGDFNNDNIQDLVFNNGSGDYVMVFIGQGDGTFQFLSNVSVGARFVGSVAVGEFNHDEIQDLVTTDAIMNTVSILLGNGNGTFKSPMIFSLEGIGNPAGISMVAIGDFNQDNNQDLVRTNSGVLDNSISVLIGKGEGFFEQGETYPVGRQPSSIVVGYFNGNLEVGGYEPPLGNSPQLKKNTNGTVTLTEKDRTVYQFNAKGLQTSEVDRNGNATSYTYNADDQLATIMYPGNARYTFSYDPTTKKLQSVTDNAGRATQFVVDANGDLRQIINPDGTSKFFTYSPDHLMLTKTNENNNTTDYIYDNFGRIKETLTPEYDVWDGAQVVRERVSTLYFPSDVKGLINDIPPGQGTPENPAPIVDPLMLTDEISGACGCDVVKAYTNPFGSLTESQDGLGRKTTYTRDPDNNATKIIYPNGRVTETTYDGRGNLLTVKENFNSAVTAFTYESIFNQVKTITDPLLNVTTFEYDPKGNLIQIKDDNDTLTEMTYTPQGLLQTITQSKGIPELENTTEFEYDPVTGNLIKTIDPLDQATNFTYDPAGNLKRILDAESKLTTYTYDLRNNYLKSVEDHLDNLTEYTYDNAGNLKTVEDARGKVTSFAYNEINLLSSILNPLNKTKQFTYNADRLLGRILDAKNQQIKFEYDAAHQLKYKYLPGETVPYGYDTGGNLTSVQDSDSKLSFTYDQLNRLTKAQTLSGYLQPATTIDYTYDKNNNRLTIKNPQAVTFKYFYDNLNRLTDIKDSVGTTTFGHYAYDALSRRTKLTYLNSTSTTYGYDLASQLTSLKNLLPNQSPFSSFDYLYNKVGYRKTMTTASGIHRYAYDDLYRLEGADHPDFADEAFTYDAVGNRLTASLSQNSSLPAPSRGMKGGGTLSSPLVGEDKGEGAWVYNAANQLLDDGTYTYTYDNNGNMVTKTEKVNLSNVTAYIYYAYNSENQLTQISLSGVTIIKYAYDGLGRRIQKSMVNGLSSIVSRYVYDNEDITAEYNASNVLQATYLHGPSIDEPIRMTQGGQDYYYHADGLGSITELTNSSGTVVQAYKYDAFGNIVSQTGTLVNPFTYTGREFDSESGLYYYRHRYYDPQIGRFLQVDPFAGFLQDPQSLNKYPYSYNNPVNLVDPLGLWSFSLDAYLIRGFGITIGKNPGGGFFMSERVGFGLGGGISFDLKGTSPGWDQCKMKAGEGQFGGVFSKAGIGFGPFSLGLSGKSGILMSDSENYEIYDNVSITYPFKLSGKFQLTFGGSVGVEATGF